MSSDVQQWRPSAAMRVAGVFEAAVGSVFTGLFVYWGAKGETSVLTVVAVAFGTVAFAAVGVGYLLRYRLALGDGMLTIVGLWRTYRIPLQHVVQARPTKSGIVFFLDDGRHIRSRAVQTAAYRRWLRDYIYIPAEDVADEVVAAASRARDGHPAVLADAQVLRRNAFRYRNAWYVRAALMGLFAAWLLYVDVSSSDSHHSSATSHSIPSLRVGECFTDADLPSSGSAVPCTAAHTKQIYAISPTTPTGTCDRSLLISSALPPVVSNEIVYLVQNGEPLTLCLVVTASITHSLVDTP